MTKKILLIILSITTITTELAYTKPNNKEINMKKSHKQQAVLN